MKLSQNIASMNVGRIARLAIVGGALVFILSGWAWWHYVRSNPERVFWGMVENNLRARGVTRFVSQDNVIQNIQVNLGPQHAAHAKALIRQRSTVSTLVNTESIGTPTADYVRYTDIRTTQKGQDGKTLDYTKILNIWGKLDAPGPTLTRGQLYNQSVLGIVPLGNLSPSARSSLMNSIRQEGIYKFKADEVKRTIVNGRPQYAFPVEIEAVKYVTMLKAYGRAAGLNHLEEIDPNVYQDSSPLNFTLKVDVWSRQLVGVVSPGGEEVLKSYGVNRPVAIPAETISADELDKRVGAIQ